MQIIDEARVKYPMLSRHRCSFHLQLQVNRTAGAPKVEPSSALVGSPSTNLWASESSHHFSILLTYSLFYLESGFLGTMSAEHNMN